MGVEDHKAFLRKMGQLDRLRTELPESAEPLVPKHWGELNTVTIAFGHGLSVAPLQAVMGDRRAGEWRHDDPADLPQAHRGRGERSAMRVIKPETSEKMRYLMRLNAEEGTAEQGRRRGLLRRRQDRHLGEGGRRPLFQDEEAATGYLFATLDWMNPFHHAADNIAELDNHSDNLSDTPFPTLHL